jgi:GTPase SAR1 family protein
MSKEKNRKIILVLGQIGSGKTTLLNSFINAL